MGEWKKMFTIEKHRADEYVELYKSLGYEVKVTEAKSCDLKEGCDICYAGGDYVEIWIKEKNKS